MARELREELWNRFKAASTTINKKHQDYFDRLHAKEKENLEAKQALIERLKVIVEPVTAEDANLSTKKWEEASAQVQAIQAEWRTIGFAPRKFNQAVYEEFRALCDAFYKAKTAHFKGIREELNANLGKKRSLVERARELAEQTRKALAEQEIIDWNATADAFRDMQAEWKKVGPIARKYSEDLWQQFSEACDTFFNAKRENAQAQRAERADQRRRKEGGLSINKMRENLRQEIKTAENNILFFTAKSKTANKLVDDMQKKIELLKKRLQELENEMDE